MKDIELREVSKTYLTGVAALHPVNMTIPAGDCLVLLGPSGSGKSTLLRIIAGLEHPDQGDVLLGGEIVNRVPPHRRGIGFLAQRPVLFPQFTVRENLRVVSRYHREDGMPLDEVSALLGLDHLQDRYPHELSGGEKQRVALGRVVMRQAGVWLLDEPFASLDPVFRTEFRHNLHLLLQALTATIVIVTHDPIDALALGRRVGVLGDGRLQHLGTPQELRHRPGNRFVAGILGQFSFLDGTLELSRGDSEPFGAIFVSGDGGARIPLSVELGQRLARLAPAELTLGIPAWQVLPANHADAPTQLAGAYNGQLAGWQVTLAEPTAQGWRVMISKNRLHLQAYWPAVEAPPRGVNTDWQFPLDACCWFHKATGERIEL